MATKKPTAARRDFRQEATDLIVDMLEKGTAPWQRPWDVKTAAGQIQMPHNGATGRAYTGGNAVYLMAKSMQAGYDDPRWLTYEQANNRGWQVRKGEKATHVEFWQFDKVEKVKDPATGQVRDQRVKLDHPIQRLYAVFNATQIDGMPPLAPKQREEWEVIEAAERALVQSGAKLTHMGVKAFYRPSTDTITLPPKASFPDQPSYYGTALHELGHWTGHPSRLNRDGITGGHPFGSEGYAREELRAELASVFMQAELGVPHDIGAHASYVDSWIAALKKDKNEIFRAAKDAGLAADYVLELSKHKEMGDELADKLIEQAMSNTTARYERLASTALADGQGQRLLAAADHAELQRLAVANISDPDDRVRLMERAPSAKLFAEKAQELDSALRELDYIESLPSHVALALPNAKDRRIVELRDIEGVAYVDKQSGDLTIAAKSPEALKNLIDRTRTPDTVVVNDTMPKTNTWAFDNTDGYAAELVKPALERLGVNDLDMRRVVALTGQERSTTIKDDINTSLNDEDKGLAAQARAHMGPAAKVYPAQPGESQYKGPIISETETQSLQQISSKSAVVHEKSAFQQAPVVNKDRNIKVSYLDGKATISTAVKEFTRGKAKELSR